LELPLYRERNFRFFFGKFLNFIFIQAFLWVCEISTIEKSSIPTEYHLV
jgi:hypothetical protein